MELCRITASVPYFTKIYISVLNKERKRHWRRASVLFDVKIWCADIRISCLTGISDTLLDTYWESNKIPDRHVTVSDIWKPSNMVSAAGSLHRCESAAFLFCRDVPINSNLSPNVLCEFTMSFFIRNQCLWHGTQSSPGAFIHRISLHIVRFFKAYRKPYLVTTRGG